MDGFRIALFIVAASVARPAPAQSLDSAFSSLDKSLALIEARTRSDPAVPGQKVQTLEAQIEGLKGAAPSLKRTERRDYARSLDAQAKMLAAAAGQTDATLVSQQLEDVSSDLSIKAQARMLGAANALRGSVRVTARTLKGGTEVSGFIVAANPVWLSGSQDLMFRFERISSPTSKDLPPGRYEFVLMRDDKIVSRQRADVGITSAEAVQLDLAAPAP